MEKKSFDFLGVLMEVVILNRLGDHTWEIPRGWEKGLWGILENDIHLGCRSNGLKSLTANLSEMGRH